MVTSDYGMNTPIIILCKCPDNIMEGGGCMELQELLISMNENELKALYALIQEIEQRRALPVVPPQTMRPPFPLSH